MSATLVETEQIWDIVTQGLKTRLSLPGFETFLHNTVPVSFSDGVLTIAVPNPFSRQWLLERCQDHIIRIASEALQQSVLLDVQIKKSTEPVEEVSAPYIPEISPEPSSPTAPTESLLPQSPLKNPKAVAPSISSQLNPRYVFETFVVGHNNRLAHAAAFAVSQAPAKAYNPLFIYGGVGLGKTHLMQAIGTKAMSLFPQLKVMYVSSEKFTNDLINAIRDDATSAFRNQYRNMDILLVDDIQFLAGKERTQEEFFHTFNALYENNKQIIISSDRSPREIPTLEDRLRSRFEWGLPVDIQTPDFETRVAILKKKAELEHMELDNEVLAYIAGQIPSNIRELEGALTRLVAYASVMKSPISIDLANTAIRDMFKPSAHRPITISSIMRTVAEECGLSVEDLCAKNRTKDVALARQIAMYLSRELTKSSLPKIGQSFGGRDHTTVMHACDRIKDGIKQDMETKELVHRITHKLEHSIDE